MMWIDWITALLPILIMLLVMLRFQWSASRAGALGWFSAVTIGFIHFGLDGEILAWSQAKAFFLALDVLLIVWGAFFLYRVADEAGSIELIRQWMPSLTNDRGMQGLLIAWAFASFLQGVGGFGVPVAVTAPLLIGLGFSPLTAVVAPSIGHAWAVTFGSLASSFQALIAASGMTAEELAPLSALLLAIAGYACGIAVAAVMEGREGVTRLALPIILMGTAMGAAQYAVVTNGLWNLGGMTAGLAGLLMGVLLSRFYPGSQRPTPSTVRINAGWAFFPYLLLIFLTLAVQFLPFLRSALSTITIQGSTPQLETTLGFVTLPAEGKPIPLLRHAGAILASTALVSYGVFRLKGQINNGGLRRIISDTVRKVMPSSMAIVAMVSMAVVMAHSGMTHALAAGLASLAGVVFPFISVWIGALGAFITGSNTNSNFIFALLQRETASILSLPVSLILAAQTTGAALGSIVSPTKVVVGASTTGLRGSEGKIIRVLMRYMLPMLVVMGMLVAGMVLL